MMRIRFEEAMMAAITINAACLGMQLLAHVRTVLSRCHDMLDAYVSSRMQHAAAKAGNVRPRRPRSTPPIAAANQSKASTRRFDLPSPDVLSEAFAAFFIGRNKAGLWVAREARGRAGGLFLFKSSAIAFARARSCATIFPDARFELDLVNEGNPIATHVANLVRCAAGLIAQ
jgi:hypothetical protein